MHIFVQVTSALAVSRSSKATLLLTSLKMLWSTQDPADTCSSCIEDRSAKKHIMWPNMRMCLNFPFAQVLGPMRVQLLHPVSRFKRVQSLQHLCRYIIVKHVRWLYRTCGNWVTLTKESNREVKGLIAVFVCLSFSLIALMMLHWLSVISATL